jgi:hypothetical protein
MTLPHLEPDEMLIAATFSTPLSRPQRGAKSKESHGQEERKQIEEE